MSRSHDRNYVKNFKELFQMLLKQVELVKSRSTGRFPNQYRKNIPALTTKNGMLKAIRKGENYIPLLYHEAYLKPLKENLDLIIKQAPYAIEDLIGPIYDLSPDTEDMSELYPWNLDEQTGQFLAVISNFYRTFLEPSRPVDDQKKAFKIDHWLPPLAIFKPMVPFPNFFTPYTFPADECELLFGGEVGVVILPASHRDHPVLWTALAHEVGGHDVMHIVPGLLQELQEKVYSFVDKKDGNSLGQLWRYWIGEATSDIYGVLFMGPAYALSQAIYIALLNDQLIPIIVNILDGQIDLEEELLEIAKEMGDKEWQKEIENKLKQLKKSKEERNKSKGQPVLNATPRPPNQNGEISYHPSDVLRLYTMVGALEVVNKKVAPGKINPFIEEGIKVIEEIIKEYMKGGDDKVIIKGALQTGSDTWRDFKEEFKWDTLKATAKKVGRFVVEEEMFSLNGNAICDLVMWDKEEIEGTDQIKKTLLSNPETRDIISNMGSDAQLLAGATLAIFENPKPDFYNAVNRRMGDALLTSFYRDEVWGDSSSALVRVWSPPG